MGTHHSRLDAKGRTSIPAPFRAALRTSSDDGSAALVLRPHQAHDCIEVWPAPAFAAFAAKLDQLDGFSDDGDDLATTLFSEAWQMEPDKEGRIVLPDALVAHAGLAESVTFLGLGTRFQIWEPNRANARSKAARDGVAARKLVIPGSRPVPRQ